MVEIVSWNIQAGLGCDGRVDLGRVASRLRRLGAPDAICLQEVARFMSDVDGGAGADQVAELAELFPGYIPVYGPGLDRAGPGSGERSQFGNLVLARRPPLQIFRHLLPQPAAAGVKHMTRQATEVVIETGSGLLRVITTHLEYYVAAHRDAQIGRLRGLHQEVCDNLAAPPLQPAEQPYSAAPRPASAILCGDFNLTPDAEQYDRLQGPLARGAFRLLDAWRLCHGERPHDPTCGLFDRQHWPQGPHCRDFFFVSDDLRDRVQGVEVDLETDASDHQPLRLVLSD